ncbi:peptide deformylase [Streptomyces misionensis]|uniref:peptide deformylase n=1 Tax=Streptomyces misionensis TaxID=67331 RepID=UPI0033FC0FFE
MGIPSGRGSGVVQYGAPVLAEVARPFDLPAEREAAEHTTTMLFASMERIGQVHPFAKGMGLAAPQISIGRAAAAVQPPGRDTPAIVLPNPRITDRSEEDDEHYEGCLSFFDVRAARTPGRGRSAPAAPSGPGTRSSVSLPTGTPRSAIVVM